MEVLEEEDRVLKVEEAVVEGEKRKSSVEEICGDRFC